MMVYSLISDIDVQSKLGVAADSESAVIMADDLRKEAENFLSSIVLNVPETGIGVSPQDWFDRVGRGSENEFRHISVTALPPCLPWGFTLSTHATLPTLATLWARQEPPGVALS
jgi:hypothetical protein